MTDIPPRRAPMRISSPDQVSQPVTPGVHAALDAVSAGALAALPTLARWPHARAIAMAGAGLAAYSLVTRYNRDSSAPLSLHTHLAVDMAQGLGFLAAGAILPDAPRSMRLALMGYGAFSIAAAALTDAGPLSHGVGRQVPMDKAALASADSGGEVAPGVHPLRTGIVNVVFVSGPDGFVLVDAGIPGSAPLIKAATTRCFGPEAKPLAILLTHGHFDHVGAADTLAAHWQIPVYAHRDELPFLTGQAEYPKADPSVGGGLMAAMAGLYPTRSPLRVAVQPLPENGSVPHLPDWEWLPTPGHAPGHVSLWRPVDRVLVAGDAVVTTRQESALSVLLNRPEIHGPPAYFTPDWQASHESVSLLASLEPEVLVTGHGPALAGPLMRRALHTLDERFDVLAVPQGTLHAPDALTG